MRGRPGEPSEIASFSLRVEAPEGWEGGELYLALTRFPGTAEERTDRRMVPIGEGTFRTQPGQSLVLHLEAEGYWGPRRLVTPESHSEPVVLTLLPAGRVEGALEVPAGEALPAEVDVVFEGAGGGKPAESEGLLARTKETCPVTDQGSFSCLLPALRLDLRVSAKGFAPVYVWGAAVRPDRVLPLGKVRLERRSSPGDDERGG